MLVYTTNNEFDRAGNHIFATVSKTKIYYLNRYHYLNYPNKSINR
jgi:hypothetical protein